MYTYIYICIFMFVYMPSFLLSFDICIYLYIYVHTYCDLLGFHQNVIQMRWDCGKNSILISGYFTGISPHWPTAWTLFKKCCENETVHMSGPPPRTRNYIKEHLVHEYFSVTCTRCSLIEFRILGGGPDL